MDNDHTYSNFNPTVSLLKILHKPEKQNSPETHSELNRIILETKNYFTPPVHPGTNEDRVFSLDNSVLITSVNQVTLSHFKPDKYF